jgi:hypothetical protein
MGFLVRLTASVGLSMCAYIGVVQTHHTLDRVAAAEAVEAYFGPPQPGPNARDLDRPTELEVERGRALIGIIAALIAAGVVGWIGWTSRSRLTPRRAARIPEGDPA